MWRAVLIMVTVIVTGCAALAYGIVALGVGPFGTMALAILGSLITVAVVRYPVVWLIERIGWWP